MKSDKGKLQEHVGIPVEKSGKRAKNSRRMWIELFPVMFILGILPLIVRLKMVNIDADLTQYAWFPGGTSMADFFAWWRSRIFVGTAVWMLVVLVYRKVVLKCKWRLEKDWGLLAGYLFFVVLSTIFSNYKEISWNGFTDNFEGCLMLLLYAFSFFYTTQVMETDRERTLLFSVFAAGAAFQCVIGISQFVGKDFWSSTIGNWLIAPGQSLSFQFSGSSENPVYMALYNPNYAAIFIVLVMPVCFYLMEKAGKKWQKTVLLIEMILLLVCLLGTGSRAGMIVLGILVVTGIWMKYRYKNFNIKSENIGNKNADASKQVSEKGEIHFGDNRNKKVYRKWYKYFIIAVIVVAAGGAGIFCVKKTVSQTPHKLQNIQITESGIEVTTSKGKFTANAKAYGNGSSLLFIKDENGEKLPVEVSEKSGRYLIKNKRFYGFSFETYEQNEGLYIVLYYRKEPFYFVKEGNENFSYVNLLGKKDTIERAETVLSTKFDRLFGSRVYIWNRVVPLLKNYIFKGSGPDTFALVFPKNDYVGQINAAQIMYEEVITKPHSFYVQTALQTGVLSLICLLLFFICCLRKMLKRNGKMWKMLALCVSGYLIMGLVNDSMVVTAPVFWVLLGMGCGK